MSYTRLNNKSSSSSSSSSSSPVKSPALEQKATFEPPRGVDDLVPAFMTDEKENSLAAVGPTFFENRLPLITLLNHVVRGEKDQANAMLTKNPMLLLGNDTVTDYSGRTHFRRTAYQLALGAVDRNVINEKGIKVVDGMVEMIEGHFHNLRQPHEEINELMTEQYQGQFPEGHEEQEAKRIASDSAALHRCLAVIKEASNADCKETHAIDDKIQEILQKDIALKNIELRDIHQSILKASSEEAFDMAFHALTTYLEQNGIKSVPFNYKVLQAIYQFRNHNEPKGPMTSGRHHNYRLSEEASRLYNKNYIDFSIGFDDQCNSPKNLLCWQKIVGYTDRFLPACDAQAVAQGIWYISENGKKSPRLLDFRHSGGKYYPLDLNPSLRLGYNCAMALVPTVFGLGPEFLHNMLCRDSFVFLTKTIISSKNITQGPKLMRQPEHPCTIM